jgi:allantoicase
MTNAGDFTRLPDLASERLGGRVLAANDEFFGPKENLLKAAKPVWIEGKYTERGKWMDGWETRRRRTPGYDWCVIRLGLAGTIRGVVVDTAYFRGNFPEQFSLEACDLGAAPYKEETKRLKAAGTRWVELLPQTGLRGDSENRFSIEHSSRFTHVRLKIYPDGGVARLRIHGEVIPPKRRLSGEFDLIAIENGGRVVSSSDEFFGAPQNLLMPGRAKNMGEGWETRRRRGPGNDWVILKMGVPGVIGRIEVDTSHFKGNYPESCSLEACYIDESVGDSAFFAVTDWKTVLPRTTLKADRMHVFRGQLLESGPATQVRFNIYPDGGVARLRIFGRAERPEDRLRGIARFNHLARAQAQRALLDCCGSQAWAQQVLAQRPYGSAERLYEAADKVWAQLGKKDWLEAFGHHRPIGGTKAKEKQSKAARRWSAEEQSAAQRASKENLAVLAAANEAYRAAFGHVFLICAAGKTGEEILQSLQQRLSNSAEVELRIAAEEQRKITRMRLEKLLGS